MGDWAGKELGAEVLLRVCHDIIPPSPPVGELGQRVAWSLLEWGFHPWSSGIWTYWESIADRIDSSEGQEGGAIHQWGWLRR